MSALFWLGFAYAAALIWQGEDDDDDGRGPRASPPAAGFPLAGGMIWGSSSGQEHGRDCVPYPGAGPRHGVLDLRQLPCFGSRYPTGGLAVIGSEGDGSCFYHSLWQAIAGPKGHSATVRDGLRFRQAMHSLACQSRDRGRAGEIVAKGRAGGQMEAVCEEMDNPVEWAHEPAIELVAKMLNLNILFYDTSAAQAQQYCSVHNRTARESFASEYAFPNQKYYLDTETRWWNGQLDNRPTVVILWVSQRSHFVLLSPVTRGGRPLYRFPPDHPFVVAAREDHC
ncbi:MAG: OTU domain-containing protein [Planctomycetota bacterium]|nr:OTU domain-containing protein [Planctomycetota bacterium]